MQDELNASYEKTAGRQSKLFWGQEWLREGILWSDKAINLKVLVP